MTAQIEFKPVSEKELPEILKIYNYYVLNTTVTWHKKELLPDQMREIVFFDDPRFQSFGIFNKNEFAGYVILGRYKEREAYDITSELSVYLKPDCLGKGIGSAAVKFLEDLAKTRGFHTLLASISGDNTRSIKLFEKAGFEKCAHFREVGAKSGQLLDVVFYQKIL